VAVQVPWYYFGNPADVGQHVDIRVLSSNLRRGRANASSFVELAKANADVITVSELTSEEVERFSRAGIAAAFPYSVLTPAADAGGIGLYSRCPVTTSPRAKHGVTIAAAQLRVPGVRFDPLVASLHVISPVASDADTFGLSRFGITSTKAEVGDFAETAGPAAVIVAGFNSTPDMRQFRDLLTNGFGDAVEQTGAGFGPTFPSRTWHPPLITIDHVLTRRATATTIRTVYITGSITARCSPPSPWRSTPRRHERARALYRLAWVPTLNAVRRCFAAGQRSPRHLPWRGGCRARAVRLQWKHLPVAHGGATGRRVRSSA
jgi:endonuclease/exonuclease/phosphatase (EEP) superfamily protein YafD